MFHKFYVFFSSYSLLFICELKAETKKLNGQKQQLQVLFGNFRIGQHSLGRTVQPF